jgi:hypothetical protein
VSFEGKVFALDDARMAKRQDWYWRSLFHIISRSDFVVYGSDD